MEERIAGKKAGIRISFVSSSRSSFSLFLSPPILETNSEFLKVETFALAGAQLLKLSITGPPTPSPSSSLLLTRGRHRYKTAFASLSNPRSYSLSLSLSLSFPSYTLCHLSSPFVSARHAYVYTRPVVHRYPVYGSRIPARGLTTNPPPTVSSHYHHPTNSFSSLSRHIFPPLCFELEESSSMGRRRGRVASSTTYQKRGTR